jgi:hypothetical protein
MPQGTRRTDIVGGYMPFAARVQRDSESDRLLTTRFGPFSLARHPSTRALQFFPQYTSERLLERFICLPHVLPQRRIDQRLIVAAAR